MSRTFLFLVILAALLYVGESEQDLRGRIGLSSISSNNKDKDYDKNFLDKILNFLHLSGQDGSSSGGDGGDGKSNGKSNGKGNGKGNDDEDCEVDNWSSWNSCSKQCGGGVRYRTCSIRKQPKGNGKKCPSTRDEQPCNTGSCGVDCTVGEWQNWGSCSKSCGGGTQHRSRPILRHQSGGGADCPDTDDDKPCNTQGCKVDCEVGPWTNWGDCTKSCGGGTQHRTREIKTQPSGGGRACPDTDDDKPCNTQGCKVDCEVGPWTNWGECSKRCGGGSRGRIRDILTNPLGGGRQCPECAQSQPCNTQSCGY